jgi:hypothetical protein
MLRHPEETHPQKAHVRQTGTVMLFLVISVVALMGVTALATDAGHVWAVRTELQRTVDAAALAAAANLVNATNTTVTLAQARSTAQNYGTLNHADGVAISIDPNADLTFGNWDLPTEIFDTTVDLTVPDNVTAVRVNARMDGAQNRSVPTILARVVGRAEFQVSRRARRISPSPSTAARSPAIPPAWTSAATSRRIPIRTPPLSPTA